MQFKAFEVEKPKSYNTYFGAKLLDEGSDLNCAMLTGEGGEVVGMKRIFKDMLGKWAETIADDMQAALKHVPDESPLKIRGNRAQLMRAPSSLNLETK